MAEQTKKWTPEENRLLLQEYQRKEVDEAYSWTKVAAAMSAEMQQRHGEHRVYTGKSCESHYRDIKDKVEDAIREDIMVISQNERPIYGGFGVRQRIPLQLLHDSERMGFNPLHHTLPQQYQQTGYGVQYPQSASTWKLCPSYLRYASIVTYAYKPSTTTL